MVDIKETLSEEEMERILQGLDPILVEGKLTRLRLRGCELRRFYRAQANGYLRHCTQEDPDGSPELEAAWTHWCDANRLPCIVVSGSLARHRVFLYLPGYWSLTLRAQQELRETLGRYLKSGTRVTVTPVSVSVTDVPWDYAIEIAQLLVEVTGKEENRDWTFE